MQTRLKWLGVGVGVGATIHWALKMLSVRGVATAAPVAGHMEIFTNRVCPFAHRAHITQLMRPPSVPVTIHYAPLSKQLLVAKRDGVEKVQFGGMFKGMGVTELEEARAALVAISPAGETPTLRLSSGEVIVESEIVSEFLDETCLNSSRPPLVPADPRRRAAMRTAMKRFNDVLPLLFRLLANQDKAMHAAIGKELEAKLQCFEGCLDEAGPWAVGGSCSLADIHCAPFLHRFQITLRHYRGYHLLSSTPRVAGLLFAVQATPEFQESVLSDEDYIAGYAENAGGMSVFSV